jgi:hypothetical protein
MKGRGQWPLRPRHSVFVLLTALLTAAFLPSFVFAVAANPPTDERHCGDIGVPGSAPTSSRLLGRSAQIFDAHQKIRHRLLVAAAAAVEPWVNAPCAVSVTWASSLTAKFQPSGAGPDREFCDRASAL